MERKYELTDETIIRNGHKLHRIRATKYFDDVKKGDLGGWIEKEENLSHFCTCWIGNDAKVYGKAKVSGEAVVCDNAEAYDYSFVSGDALVYGNAKVFGSAVLKDEVLVFDSAEISGDAVISGSAMVFGKATVSNNAEVGDNALVYALSALTGSAKVYGNAEVTGRALICGGAQVYGDASVSGRTVICGEARVYGGAKVHGEAKVYGDVRVFGSANICGQDDISTGSFGGEDAKETIQSESTVDGDLMGWIEEWVRNENKPRFSFGEALEKMKRNEKMTRDEWGDCFYVKLIPAEKTIDEIDIKPYLCVCRGSDQEPYNPSQGDLLTNDWIEYK